MKLNTPTILTLLRILTIPVAVLIYYLPVGWAHPVAAICVFIGGALDFLDGYLARKWDQGTRFGAFLDPVADKLAVATSFVVIASYYSSILITIASIIIICREILISSLREWMAEVGKRATVKVHMIGKVKMVLQGLAILFLIWFNPGSDQWVFICGCLCLFAAVILTLWSMIYYLKQSWSELTRDLA